MDSDILKLIGVANMVRVGIIISIDGEENTAVVELQEFSASGSGTYTATLMQQKVRRTVRTLNRGTKGVKHYFNYTPGEKVLCLFPVKIGGGSLIAESVGYIAGSFYDDDNYPPVFFDKVQAIDFGCGSIEINLEDKSLAIEFDGDISINGKEIFLNG